YSSRTSLLNRYTHPGHHNSFPTRRSSDLEAPGAERLVERRLVDHAAAGGVHQYRRRLHSRQFRLPDHVAGFVGTGANEADGGIGDRKSTRLNSSHVANSYAVYCLKKKSSK